ncbi:hypothetical protein K435DRAFT_968835 [Dendrothele bispora CBS 962.96]|uniref:Uncharacterized protein n=1 Tax=Dendrothele bispora (strain CBS 962.96) TaxID=1314807 RepID=A0A4S8LMN4_DENBC|nr:hypothetical protein K435DRAFT_968835 [Dendrothele bispora CBS 962.96]
MGEARIQEMQMETTPEPRSLQEHHTPILSFPQQKSSSPYLNPMSRTPPNLPNPMPHNSPHSSNGSSIRILQPWESRDQVILPSKLHPFNTWTYQSQYDLAMGGALNPNQPALTTNSSQPKRYPTQHDALEDVGRQCRRLGEALGVCGLNNMSLEDHIQSVRALAEAREIDLPIWVASQIREMDVNRELNRLYTIIRQPDVVLVAPEDLSLPDPWGLTPRVSSPSSIPSCLSWQQLEQQRALEMEIKREKWRESMADRVRSNASDVLQQRGLEHQPDQWRPYVHSEVEPIPRPTNPAVPSTTIYPSSSITETNPSIPRVKIVEPTETEHSNEGRMEPNYVGSPSESGINLGKTYQYQDVPLHQAPAQPTLKSGNLRPEGYKYTLFPKKLNQDTNLRQSRRPLREILEDVEGERKKENVGTRIHKSTIKDRSLGNDSYHRVPIRQTSYSQASVPIDRPNWSDDRQNMAEDEKRIEEWERQGSHQDRTYQNPSGGLPDSSDRTPSGAPPPPPPPPPSPSPPNPTPPPNRAYYRGDPDPVDPLALNTKLDNSARIRSKDQMDDKSTRDAIAWESNLEIRKPTAFDGSNRELWHPFLSDWYRMFSTKPTIYSTDQSQVTYTSSWFTGTVARYYQNQVEQGMENDLWIPTLHEWPVFIKESGRIFGIHAEVLHAQSLLDRVIQQFGESFADFIVRFGNAALKTLYNDPAKQWRGNLRLQYSTRPSRARV